MVNPAAGARLLTAVYQGDVTDDGSASGVAAVTLATQGSGGSGSGNGFLSDSSTGNNSYMLGSGSDSRVSINGGPGNGNESIRTLELRPSDTGNGGIRTLEIGPGSSEDAGVNRMLVFVPLVVAAPVVIEAVVAAGVGGVTETLVVVGGGGAVTGIVTIIAARNGLPFEGAATIDARERNEMGRLVWDWVLGVPDRQPATPAALPAAAVGDSGSGYFGPDTTPAPDTQANPATGGASGGSKPPEKPPGSTLPPPAGPEDGKGDDKTPPEGFKDAEEAAKAARGEPLGRGNTGNSTPADLRQQVALNLAKKHPAAGKELPTPMTDPRWPGKDGWVKMAHNINGVEIHYV